MEKEKRVDVLLVEDNLDDTELTIYSLINANDNLSPRHFSNGEDALHYILEEKTFLGQSTIDSLKLIILDLDLTNKMNGMEIIRRIKADEKSRSIPVVVFSASSSQQDIHRAYQLGANSYVIKPKGFDGYLKKIGSLANYWSRVNERIF